MAMPLMCRQARPFVISPFPFPENYIAALAARPDREHHQPDTSKHVIHQAIEWRDMLRADKTLSMAQIAKNQGLSRARVTQIMNLLQLPRRILQTLRQTTSPDEIQRYSERRLRQILPIHGEAERIQAFADMQQISRP